MVALGPSCPLKSERSPSDDDRGNQQRQKPHAIDPRCRHITSYDHLVGNLRVHRVGLWFDAQIIVARWNRRDGDGVVGATFGPGAIAVVTVIEAHLSSKVPGFAGVLID